MRSVKKFEADLSSISTSIAKASSAWDKMRQRIMPISAAASKVSNAMASLATLSGKVSSHWDALNTKATKFLSLIRSIAMASLPLKMLSSLMSVGDARVNSDNGSGERRFGAAGLKTTEKNFLALQRAEKLNKTNGMFEGLASGIQQAINDTEKWGGLASLGIGDAKMKEYRKLDGIDAMFKILGDVDAFFKKNGGINPSTLAAANEGLGVLGLDVNTLRQAMQFRGEVASDFGKSRKNIKHDDAKLRSSEKALESLNFAIENAKYRFLEFIGPTLDKVAQMIERWFNGDFIGVIKELKDSLKKAFAEFDFNKIIGDALSSLSNMVGADIDLEKIFGTSFKVGKVAFEWLIKRLESLKPAVDVLLSALEWLADGIGAILKGILSAMRWLSEKTGINFLSKEEYAAFNEAFKSKKEREAEKKAREETAYKAMDMAISLANSQGLGDIASGIKRIKEADEKATKIVVLTKPDKDNKVVFAVADAESGERLTEWETLIQMDARARRGFK